jgi:hypothetical protein
MDREIIGYQETQEGYKEILKRRSGGIYTQALITCTDCKTMISSSGGPRYNSVCVNCYGIRKLAGFVDGKKV